VALSGAIHEQVRGKLDASFDNAGPHKVKNIARPVQVWRWSPAPASEPAAPGAPLPLPAKPSIAVLPFANMSGDAEQEYFADGITEDLITALSHLRWMFVIARNSTFAYKGNSPDIRRVASDLGVRYVLEGSVRKAGNRIRLTAQLIDGETGNHIWAERYDRQLEDIFDLQDELTVTIAGAIGPALDQAERARASARYLENPGAWDVYQKGMSLMHKRTRSDLEAAQVLFARAIALDPNLAPAYSAAAEACFFQIVDGVTETPEERKEAALAFGSRAVELDNQDAGAHYALGRAFTVRREHERAIPELRKAVELNPSYAWAHYALGMAYGTSGSPEKAIVPIEMAMRLSPYDTYLGQFMVHLSEAYLVMGRHEEALAWAERSLREPNFRWSRYAVLISALGHLGRLDEAARAVRALSEFRPDVTVTFAGDWWPISHRPSLDYVLEGLRKAGLKE
jgi:adenylate cyclase